MPRSILFLFLGAVALPSAPGCGGIARTTPETTTQTTFGTSGGDDDAGATNEIPTKHRPSGSVCPAQRGAGSICTDGPGDAAADPCKVDSDCTAGPNGRCFSPNGPGPASCSPTSCSYDACQSDSDCPSRVPCECRSSSADSSPNVCATGSNCAVDSDCGVGGYCSPGASTSFCEEPIYFCHTPKDTCINDSDCPLVATTTVLQGCNYDTTLGHFACSDVCLPPP